MAPSKSLLERLFQAFVFEALAILLSTFLFAWAMGTDLFDMGALSLANSLVAVIWNVVVNSGFDRARRRFGFAMSVPVRIAHAVAFEGGIMALTLPLAMWWLRLGIWPALVFESSALVVFLMYTYAYHWAYDVLRDRIIGRRDVMI